jgi:hypothetical protein
VLALIRFGRAPGYSSVDGALWRAGGGGEMSSREHKAVVDAVPRQSHIGGQWRDAAGGQTLRVRRDPATGETLAHLAYARRDDAWAALESAHRTREEWGRRRASGARSCGAPTS